MYNHNNQATWTNDDLSQVEAEMQKEFSQAPKDVITLAVRLCQRKLTPGAGANYLLDAVRTTLSKREAQLS